MIPYYSSVNILIIDNSIAFTGAFKCALNEAEILSGQHRFIFALPSGSKVAPIAEEKGYKVYSVPFREISKSPEAILQYPFVLIRNLFTLRSIVRKEQIDIVQVNDFYNLLGALLKLTGYKGKLLTYVRFLPSSIPAPLRSLWTKIAQKFSHRVIAVSDAVLKELPDHSRSIRIYDPVKLEEKYPAEGISDNDTESVQLLYLANFIRGKGQEHALAAFHNAFKQNTSLRLRFVGGDMGLPKNAAFKAALENSVSQMHLEDVVLFANFAADVERELKQADILLNFSEAESFSMTCLEAGFYGIPVIATRCGGPEEIVKDGTTGLLVERKDVAAMTAAILTLASDEKKRIAMRDAVRSYVREKFSIGKFQNDFSQILQ